jgi:hypothetical protein
MTDRSTRGELTEADVQAIRLRWMTTADPISVIARDYRVDRSTISHMLHGRRWQSLPWPKTRIRTVRNPK